MKLIIRAGKTRIIHKRSPVPLPQCKILPHLGTQTSDVKELDIVDQGKIIEFDHDAQLVIIKREEK